MTIILILMKIFMNHIFFISIENIYYISDFIIIQLMILDIHIILIHYLIRSASHIA